MPAEAYLGDAAPRCGQEGKMARRRTVKRSANRALGGVEMTRRIRRKLVRRGALALAAIFVVAPAAQARPAAQFATPPTVAVHDSHEQGASVTAPRNGRTIVMHKSGLILTPNGGPLLRVKGSDIQVDRSQVASTAVESQGFDWNDAGIGAGVALASALLLAFAWRGRQLLSSRLAGA
jgi:hypothetical protein